MSVNAECAKDPSNETKEGIIGNDFAESKLMQLDKVLSKEHPTTVYSYVGKKLKLILTLYV